MFLVIVNENNFTTKILHFENKRFQEISFMKECQLLKHEPNDIDFENNYFIGQNNTVQMINL